MVLKDKNIILGITGGIAAYKALELTRLLKKEGAHVWPIMTGSAKKLITALSFETLAGNPVLDDLFAQSAQSAQSEGSRISHIELTDRADLVVIVPATANILGK